MMTANPGPPRGAEEPASNLPGQDMLTVGSPPLAASITAHGPAPPRSLTPPGRGQGGPREPFAARAPVPNLCPKPRKPANGVVQGRKGCEQSEG